MTGLPDWLEPVREGADRITVDDLTRFRPPDDHAGRYGAVLVLFGESEHGPDILLTERAHHMRSHPAQVSFPGGAIDPGEDAVQAALREAEEETGLDPGGVAIFGSLPDLWLPPSNFAVTPVLAWWQDESEVRVVDPDEVHAVHRVTLDYLLDPEHRLVVRHPARPQYTSPAFELPGDVILWGFTAGILSRLFDFVGWSVPWDTERVRDVPLHMLQGDPTVAEMQDHPRPNTRFRGPL